MTVKWMRRWLSLALGILLLLSADPGVAGEANDQLKQSVDKVLAILSDPTLKGTGNSQQRLQKLKEVVYFRFDFNEMAKRALGSQWQKRSPEEQKEFVQLFTSLLEHAYLENIESYNGEKIRFLNERQDKDFAEVNTKVINNKGQEFSLDYRLQNVNGDWRVIDVVIGEKYAVLVDALYAGKTEQFIETRVRFEDGRVGAVSATLALRDASTYTRAASAPPVAQREAA